MQSLYQGAFEQLDGEGLPEIVLATYFGDARPNLVAIKNSPVAGFH